MPRTFLCTACLGWLTVTDGSTALDTAYAHVVENLDAHPMRYLTVLDLDGAFEAIMRRSFGTEAFP